MGLCSGCGTGLGYVSLTSRQVGNRHSQAYPGRGVVCLWVGRQSLV